MAVWTHSDPLWTCCTCAASSYRWVWRMSSAWPCIETEFPSVHHQASVCALSLIQPEQKNYTEIGVLLRSVNLQFIIIYYNYEEFCPTYHCSGPPAASLNWPSLCTLDNEDVFYSSWAHQPLPPPVCLLWNFPAVLYMEHSWWRLCRPPADDCLRVNRISAGQGRFAETSEGCKGRKSL